MTRTEQQAVRACREYEHWASEIRRLTEEIGLVECPRESPPEAETHWKGAPSCFREASEERLDQAYHYGEEAESYRRRTLDEIAAAVAGCPACTRLVALIRARKHARKRYGVAKRAVRRAGKMAAAPTPDAFLIAAAPDLLDALRDAERLLNHMGDILNGMDCVEESDEEMATPIFAKVEAAIAKATGAATPTGEDR